MYVEGIEIERSPALFHLIIKTSRPGLLIGRKGEGADKIKAQIIGIMKKNKSRNTQRNKIDRGRNPASGIKRQDFGPDGGGKSGKRMPFRRTMKQIMEKAMASHNVKGVKVAMSGRLDGSEMGRKEWLRKGRIPLQTLRADIDFAREKAHLPYGDIGIKVWTYKGEKFEAEEKKI